MNESALEGFVKIVELNSFSAAAEALYLSQSALSQQIRTLEGQLQFELFQHVPRRVVLTPAGRDFYPKAKQLVALYQQAVRHARAVQQQENPPERHLIIAGCHEAMRMFAYDLFSLMYQTVYETSLVQEGLERGVSFTPVGGIRSAAYGDPALKMVPAVYYRRPDLSFVRVLDWGRGHRFGIVLGQKREDPVVMAYVRALQQQLPSLSEKLFGLKLEPVEES